MVSYFFFDLFAAWVKAEAATFFTAAGVFGSRKSFPAVLATFGEVFSFAGFFAVAMVAPFKGLVGSTSIFQRKRAIAKQVGESTKGGGVGVFHACIVFFLAFSGTPNNP